MANLADRTVAIIGIDIEQNSHSAGPVALERKLLVGRTRKFAGAPLDRALDVVLGHVLALGGENCAAQPRIRIRIAAAILRSNADFLDETGKNLAALGVQRALLVLDCGPL